MLRSLLILITVLSSCSAALTQQFQKIENSDNLHLKTNQFSGVIFHPNTITNRISVVTFVPTIDEIRKAEEIFAHCLNTKRTDSNGVMTNVELIQPIRKYYRQYFGNIKPNGQKAIKLNFVLKSRAREYDWKRQEVLVLDGGNAYFQVVVNIATGDCYDFYVNGGA